MHDQITIVDKDNWNFSLVTPPYGSPSTSSECPPPRYAHQCYYVKNRIYVHGGVTKDIEMMSTLYLFDFKFQRWQKISFRGKENNEGVAWHSSAQVGPKVYVFGGSNSTLKCNNSMHRFNLETFDYLKIEGKGDVPAPRESSALIALEKSWLVLYGGLNINDTQIYNNFYFYHIDSKTWYRCSGSYEYLIYSRLDFGLCLNENQKMYLYGGCYRNNNNQEQYLNDFYEIEVGVPTKNGNTHGRIMAKRLISKVQPGNRAGHSLVSYKKYLILIGGQKGQKAISNSTFSSVWVFSIQKKTWTEVQSSKINQNIYKNKSHFSCTESTNGNLLLFGGLLASSSSVSQLYQLQLDLNTLQFTKQSPLCKLCVQKQKGLQFKPRYFSPKIIEQLAYYLQFPFCAFGLLSDNCINFGASFMNIVVCDGKIKDKVRKMIKIEDNSKYPWSQEELISAMGCFQGGVNLITTGMDKKLKFNLNKEQQRREFGCNIKLAALKIGEGFLYIIFHSVSEIRVCLFSKLDINTPEERFAFLYYSFNQQTNQLTNQSMAQLRNKVDELYGEMIWQAIRRKNQRNTLFIFRPRIEQQRSYYNPDFHLFTTHNNDIITGNIATIQRLQHLGYSVYESVDVSLRSYLSLLYLKNQFLKISLSVRNKQLYQIHPQNSLDKIDRLCRAKHVFEIQNMLEFQLKIVELYYIPDLVRRLNFFSNGLLLYHRNRLITRYKYKLGELISRKNHKARDGTNFLHFFGYAELPDNIPVNIFKTDFTFNIMLEKLYSRVKFMNKYLKKKNNRVIDKNFKRIVPATPITKRDLQAQVKKEQEPEIMVINDEEENKNRNGQAVCQVVTINENKEKSQSKGEKLENQYNQNYELQKQMVALNKDKDKNEEQAIIQEPNLDQQIKRIHFNKMDRQQDNDQPSDSSSSENSQDNYDEDEQIRQDPQILDKSKQKVDFQQQEPAILSNRQQNEEIVQNKQIMQEQKGQLVLQKERQAQSN